MQKSTLFGGLRPRRGKGERPALLPLQKEAIPLLQRAIPSLRQVRQATIFDGEGPQSCAESLHQDHLVNYSINTQARARKGSIVTPSERRALTPRIADGTATPLEVEEWNKAMTRELEGRSPIKRFKAWILGALGLAILLAGCITEPVERAVDKVKTTIDPPKADTIKADTLYPAPPAPQ